MDSISSIQLSKGAWDSALITLDSLSIASKCSNPIKHSQIQKYKNTLAAFREGSLLSEYVTITQYRVDEDSEKQLKSLRTTFILMILVFIGVVVGLGWKIRQFNKSILETKVEIEAERMKLVEQQDEVVRLRKLKLMRVQELQ